MSSGSNNNINVTSSNGISVLVFTGDDADCTYEDWKNRMECLFSIKDIKHVFENGFTYPTTGTGANNTFTDDEKKLIKENKTAKTWIKMATKGAPYALIKNKAIAKDMMKILDEEYELSTKSYHLEQVELMFNNLKLEDGDKPSVFFVKLEEINDKFTQFHVAGGKEYKKDSQELVIKTSNSVGEDSEYRKVISTWKTKIDSTTDANTKYVDLKRVLKEYYAENFSHLTTLKENTNKGSLVMNTELGKTGTPKVTCGHCGKKGHSESQCWIKNPSLRPRKFQKQQEKPTGNKERKCWVCGSTNHVKKDCPQQKSNNDNATSINSMFLGVTIVAAATKVVVERNRWLADTGAQTHTLCDEDVSMMNKQDMEEKVQGFNGSSVMIKKRGDICVRDTSTGSVVRLNNVRKSGAIQKNIISIGQLQKEGWVMRGHYGLIVMEKGEQIIRFMKSGEENLYYLDGIIQKTSENFNIETMEVEEERDIGTEEEDKDSDVDDVPDLHEQGDSDSDEDSDSDDNEPPLLDYKSDSSGDEDIASVVVDMDTDEDGPWEDDDYYFDGKNYHVKEANYTQEEWAAVMKRIESGSMIPGDSEFLFRLHMKDPVWCEEGGKVFMNTPTDSNKYKGENNPYSALVSDDESGSDDEEDDDDEEEELPALEERNEELEEKRVRFEEEKTKHPKGILKNKEREKEKETPIPRAEKGPKKTMDLDINVAHDQWGHHGIRRLKEMAKENGYRLTGEMEPCDACGVSKASQTRISKTTEIKATAPGERMFVDTTGPFSDGPLKNKYLEGAVDDYSGKMHAQFSASKKQMTPFVKNLIEKCKGEGKPIKYIRMDGGGENEGIVKMSGEHGITIEKTPPHTPQYNGRIERRFPVIISMAMAMIWAAGFTTEMKKKLLGEAISTAMFLHDLTPTARNSKSAIELWNGKPSGWKLSDLVEFGRVGIVKIKDKHVKKGEEKGVPMVMVGYALDSPVGTYRMFNPVTKRIVTSDSVTWSKFNKWKISGDVKGIYEEAKSLNKDGISTYDEGGILLGDEDISPVENNAEKSGGTMTQSTANQKTPERSHHMQTRSRTKVKVAAVSMGGKKAPKRPVTSDGKRKVTGDTRVKPIILDDGMALLAEEKKGDKSLVNTALFIFSTALNSDPGEPTTDAEALNGPESDWWFPSCIAEINNFLDRGSWKFVPRKVVKQLGRKLIGTKMVYKKKDEPDGTIRYKSRCVSKGFMQIPGVDFTEKFSPVATDASIRTVLALILFFWDSEGWRARGIDIEAAFLEGFLQKKYYLEPPKILVLLGFMTEEEHRDYCIELQKGMYGQVDAALRFFVRFQDYLESKECKMKQSKADPCIFYKKNDKGFPLVVAAITVDDCLIGGKPKEMDIFMDDVEKEFNIVKEMVIRKHLGVTYEFKRDDDGDMCAICTMEKKANDIVETYEKFMDKEARIYPSPGAPGTVLDKNEGEMVEIDMYRKIVGKAMFFGTKVGPKMCNAVRDLSRHMSNPGEPHWKALGRLVGYVKGMRLKGMLMKKPVALHPVSYCDADFAKDPVTRRSVGGELATIGGCLVDFGSRGEKSISHSTAESEYKSLSTGGKNMKFIQMLMEEIAFVEVPGVLGEDNEGCEFLVKNKQVSSRTKHIDVAIHSIREFCSPNEKGITRGIVMRVPSEENTSDICTKNTDVATFKYHEAEIDNGFPKMRQKVFDANGFVSKIDQKLLGGMLSEDVQKDPMWDRETQE